MRVFLFSASLLVTLVMGCKPAQRPSDIPGPPGCGLREPGNTAPGMLSFVQKKTMKSMGTPDLTERNTFGGLTWVYRHSRGSVFGEDQLETRFAFDAGGILRDQREDVLKHVGK